MRKLEINPVILGVKEIKSSQTTSKVKGNNWCQDREKSRDVAIGRIMWVMAR